MSPSTSPSAWRATLAGLAASLVGIGLARFAYTPLLPAIIEAGWFGAADAAYLGAANLAGYLAGAWFASQLARRFGARAVLRAAMALTTASLLACAWPVDFGWFFGWRFVSGVTGGVLMVLAAPTVLPLVDASRRGLAGGAIFTGVGLGIAASGTLVPLLLQQGLGSTWLGLGALSFVLTTFAWNGWPATAANAPASPAAAPQEALPRRPLRALYAAYALNAAGLVPHMIFLVDFIARGLGQGLAAGASYWVAFGVGALVGPMLAGQLADRIGFGLALRLALVVQAFAVAIPLVTHTPAWLVVSSVVVGAFTPGIVPLVLGRIHELLPQRPEAQRSAWRSATTGFALLQTVAAYGMSWLLVESGGQHGLLFGLGAAAIVLALAVDLVSRARR